MMNDEFFQAIPGRTIKFVKLKRHQPLFERDDRTLPATGVLMLVFSICGMAFGFLGRTDAQVTVLTMVGAAIGMTLSFCWRILVR